MKILAIDTATEGCSVALLHDETVIERFAITPRGHADRVLDMVRDVLAEGQLSLAQLDAIAFDRGPGSFTGVRIGCSVAQGFGFAVDLPLVGVSSLQALAAVALREHAHANHVCAMIDARMNEIYAGCYVREERVPQLLGEEVVLPAGQLVLPNAEPAWLAAGTGWSAYRTDFSNELYQQVSAGDGAALPHAAEVAQLAVFAFNAGEAIAAELAHPTYLRDRVTG
jgi:tRNA threonylcarbamoyladenosine biosynthesis protein TsaB